MRLIVQLPIKAGGWDAPIACRSNLQPWHFCESSYFYFIISWEMTRGNDLNGKHDEWKFSGLNIAWVGNISDWIFWIGVIRVWIFWVVIILGGSFLGCNCPGGSYPGWELSRWELSWVGVFLGGNVLAGSYLVEIIRVKTFWVGGFLVPIKEEGNYIFVSFTKEYALKALMFTWLSFVSLIIWTCLRLEE